MSQPNDPAAMTLAEVAQLAAAIRGQIAKAIVGQTQTVDHLLIALLAQGHVLLEGPPGTGKSQTITNLIAACLASSQVSMSFGPLSLNGMTWEIPSSSIHFRSKSSSALARDF